MEVIEMFAQKTETDQYFISLFKKLENAYFNKVLGGTQEEHFSQKEFYHLLRFADILCRAKESKFRQKAYKIISLLNECYSNDIEFKVYAEAILIKLGNFPAKKIINKDENIYTSIELNLEKAIKETYQKTIDEKNIFTDKQYELFEKLKNSNHYSFSGPTSFGKSFIIEEFIKYIIKQRNGIDNIVILVPTRALISQMRKQLKKNVTEFNNYKIIEYPEIPYIYREYKYIFIFTPERLISYLGNPDNPNIDYMFIDEAQKIISNKDTRSPLYYHTILLAQRKSIKLYFASPNIPNADIFLRIFEKSQTENMNIEESPVTQNKFYIDLLENQYYAINDENDLINIKSKIGMEIEKYENIRDKLNRIIKYIGWNNQNIVYCNSIHDTINIAINFSKELKDKDDEEIDNLIKLIKENIHDEYFLIDCLKKGIAFHFGKLPQRIREKVEDLFRKGNIEYIFCTSTLLEGVNLPAKNIFILSNSISRSKFTDIEFLNLAGRAGRLKYELLGNVICIRYSNKKNTWNGIEKDKDIIQKNKIEDLTYDVLDGKNNFYKNLGKAIQNKDFTNKSASESQKRIWKNYSNLVIMHANENNSSILIKEFYEKNKDAKKILAVAQKENKVPNFILEQCPDIGIEYQNKILNNNDNYRFPKEITKNTCKEVLKCLYDAYNWKEEESRGDNPLVRNEKRLNYLKHLMYNWIKSRNLKAIISIVIRYYSKKGILYRNGRVEPFQRNNKDQINQIINDIMGGIDTDLRFKIKNYMTNYYLLMCEKYGKENAGEDWTPYIEYGTLSLKNIELQKLGLSIHVANFLLDNIKEGIKFDGNCLIEIDKEKILGQIDKRENKEEYNEVLDKL